MKILLLSAYDADSHKYWREGLVAHLSEHQWTVLTLPGRYFSWRVRGNSMSWAFGEQADILRASYDLVIATSMTDLSALRGFIPSLGHIPTLVYFHENQFDYPATQAARTAVEPQILNIYTALAADQLAFNSQYNLDTFITGVSALLKKLPDQVPANIARKLRAKACVLAVPLQINKLTDPHHSQLDWHRYNGRKATERPLLIAWAARWEYDKGPDRLLAFVQALEQTGLDYRLCILGQKFRQVPVEFSQLRRDFSHRIDQFGYVDSAVQYRQWLLCADIFFSSAIHEFQGLSVLEAAAAGCVPLLPNRLVYPELFPDHCLYHGAADLATEANNAVEKAQQQWQLIQRGTFPVLNPPLSWTELKDKYQQLMKKTVASNT